MNRANRSSQPFHVSFMVEKNIVDRLKNQIVGSGDFLANLGVLSLKLDGCEVLSFDSPSPVVEKINNTGSASSQPPAIRSPTNSIGMTLLSSDDRKVTDATFSAKETKKMRLQHSKEETKFATWGDQATSSVPYPSAVSNFFEESPNQKLMNCMQVNPSAEFCGTYDRTTCLKSSSAHQLTDIPPATSYPLPQTTKSRQSKRRKLQNEIPLSSQPYFSAPNNFSYNNYHESFSNMSHFQNRNMTPEFHNFRMMQNFYQHHVSKHEIDVDRLYGDFNSYHAGNSRFDFNPHFYSEAMPNQRTECEFKSSIIENNNYLSSFGINPARNIMDNHLSPPAKSLSESRIQPEEMENQDKFIDADCLERFICSNEELAFSDCLDDLDNLLDFNVDLSEDLSSLDIPVSDPSNSLDKPISSDCSHEETARISQQHRDILSEMSDIPSNQSATDIPSHQSATNDHQTTNSLPADKVATISFNTEKSRKRTLLSTQSEESRDMINLPDIAGNNQPKTNIFGTDSQDVVHQSDSQSEYKDRILPFLRPTCQSPKVALRRIEEDLVDQAKKKFSNISHQHLKDDEIYLNKNSLKCDDSSTVSSAVENFKQSSNTLKTRILHQPAPSNSGQNENSCNRAAAVSASAPFSVTPGLIDSNPSTEVGSSQYGLTPQQHSLNFSPGMTSDSDGSPRLSTDDDGSSGGGGGGSKTSGLLLSPPNWTSDVVGSAGLEYFGSSATFARNDILTAEVGFTA